MEQAATFHAVSTVSFRGGCRLCVHASYSEKFSAFYLKDNRITDALFVNDGTEIQMMRTLIERRTVFNNPEALGDAGLEIARLAS
jgi:hypothetical protein